MIKHLKANEKLPRGTYLYIRVGDRIYAGEAVTIQETKVTTPSSIYTSGHMRSGRRRSWRNWYGGSLTKMSPRLAQYYAKRDGRPVPSYYIEDEATPDPTLKSVTGSTPVLTDVIAEAKRFRRKSQAELACKKLEAVYGGLDIPIRIELHKGDK